MEETALKEKLENLEKKVEAIYISVEKTRKYYLWSAGLTFVAFVLPLIGLVFVIPTFLASYQGILSL